MSLEAKITESLKNALKAKDKLALEALRAIKSEILLLKTKAVGSEVSEKEEIALLQKLIKQRKEAAEQFANAGREDAKNKELDQAKVIQTFLPTQLNQEELIEKLKEIIAKTGASNPKDMGKVMGAASKELAGKADGKTISETVKKLLSS